VRALLGTVDNHGNTEITETVTMNAVILPKCRDFAVFFAKMP